MKCQACNGTGKKGLYVFRKCYRCGGKGKTTKRKQKK